MNTLNIQFSDGDSEIKLNVVLKTRQEELDAELWRGIHENYHSFRDALAVQINKTMLKAINLGGVTIKELALAARKVAGLDTNSALVHGNHERRKPYPESIGEKSGLKNWPGGEPKYKKTWTGGWVAI